MSDEREAVEIVVGNMTVRGQRWGRGFNWIVLLHDLGQDLDIWADLPARLMRAGYVALPFDLPGHGLSDDPWRPEHFSTVIGQVIAFGRRAGAHRLFLVVAGKVADLCLAADQLAVDGMAVLSPRAAGQGSSVFSHGPALFLAGAAAPEALAATRAAFAAYPGWAGLSTFPVGEQGGGLMHSAWVAHVAEQLSLFFRPYSLSVAPE